MARVNLSIILFLLVLNAWGRPFWSSPEPHKRILEERAILVSAKIGQTENLQTMSVAGAGAVNVPLSSTYEIITQFEDLTKVTDRFHEVRFNKRENLLFTHMSALGYHVKMTLKLQFHEGEGYKTISFESVKGGFVGMKGAIDLRTIDARRTLMSINSDYKTEKLPLPKALMGIGLEIVTQRAAGKMREFIEKEYKK